MPVSKWIFNGVKSMKKEKKQKTPKPKKQKKEKYEEYHGLTGDGVDYHVYHLNAAETLLAVLVGGGAGFLAAYIYFGNAILSFLVGAVAAWKAVPLYRDRLQRKRVNALTLQFRDMLESLSNSYTVGRNANDAFTDALEDMRAEHGENAYITKELQLIRHARDMYGIEIRDLVVDLGKRSGIDDINSFSSVFAISSDLGGDVGKVIRETRDIISDKIEIQMEIQTMVTSQKNELNIMAVMPFIVVFATNMLVSSPNNILVLGIKLVALVIFVFSYWMGSKIVQIKI